MSLIYVKTVKGRVARTAPRGDYIPDDRYVAVKDTKYIRRLLEVHGDIELEPKKSKTAPVASPGKEATAPAPAVAKEKAD